jgi:hypothetical protein
MGMLPAELYAFNVELEAKACSMFFDNVIAKFFDGFEESSPGTFVLFFDHLHNCVKKSVETGSNPF